MYVVSLINRFQGEKVFEVLDKAVEEKKENAVCRLTAETGVSLKEIQYIKSNDKYIEIYTENGVVPGYISLKECEDILPVQTFSILNQTINILRFIRKMVLCRDISV